MEPKVIAKQMIDFQKTAFDNTFDAVVMFQNQTEKMANTMLEQASWLPEEGKKAIKEWGNMYKKGRDNFKKTVDENFKKAQDMFSESASVGISSNK